MKITSLIIVSAMVFSPVHAELLRAQWFIDEMYAQNYLPLVDKFLQKEAFSAEDLRMIEKNKIDCQPGFYDPVASTVFKDETTWQNPVELFNKAPKGSVAIIPILGPTMKTDWCGTAGTQTIGSWLKLADNHPHMIGSILLSDTPGGSSNGPAEFSDIVSACLKPTVGFIDGLTCSAGYFMISGAKEIMASSPGAIVGSLGTMMTLRDLTERNKLLGIRETTIVSDLSPKKNKSAQDAMNGNTQPVKDEFLNPLTQVFHSYIIKNRKGKIPDPQSGKGALSGSVFVARLADAKQPDGLKMGLIDSIGNLEAAVQRVRYLASQPKTAYRLVA